MAVLLVARLPVVVVIRRKGEEASVSWEENRVEKKNMHEVVSS